MRLDNAVVFARCCIETATVAGEYLAFVIGAVLSPHRQSFALLLGVFLDTQLRNEHFSMGF
jgi:hypothetical protein